MFHREAMLALSLDSKILWMGIGRSGYIDDDESSWEVLYKNRKSIQMIAHTHPGRGIPAPSERDKLTFANMRSSGFENKWCILTEDHFLDVESQVTIPIGDLCFIPGSAKILQWITVLRTLSSAQTTETARKLIKFYKVVYPRL